MITVKDITKTYGNNIIFKNFSLGIKTGDFVAFTGASGQGKTTLLNMMGILESVDAGQIFFDDIPITYRSLQARILHRDKIGFLFQNFALVNELSIYENIKLGIHQKHFKNITNKEIINVLKQVGINKDLNSKIYTLSGGEQQRVAIARLILKKCDYIFADEPTGSLDAKNDQVIFKILRKLNAAGTTIILVTHDEQLANLCHKKINISQY